MTKEVPREKLMEIIAVLERRLSDCTEMLYANKKINEKIFEKCGDCPKLFGIKYCDGANNGND